MTVWRVMTWVLAGSRQKSNAEVKRLISDVMRAPDFKPEELEGFDIQTATARLDDADKGLPQEDAFVRDKWRRTHVDLLIPTREKKLRG